MERTRQVDDSKRDASAGKTTVPAIHRASMVLEAVSSAPQGLLFGDLVAAVALPRSSLHNVCVSMTREGLLERREDGRFQIGWRVVELARSRLRRMDVVRAFLDTVDNGGLTLTAVLAILRGPEVTYVAVRPGGESIAIHYDVGMSLPAAFTASGKALLATLEDEKIKRLIGPMAVSDAVYAGPKTIDLLLEQLRDVRKRGYAIDDEETARGMMCAGAFIAGAERGDALSAVALSCVREGQRAEVIGARVVQLAKQVSSLLGRERT